MIPFSEDQISRYTAQGAWGTATLDDIFRANAKVSPNRLALADAPNRETVTSGPPGRYTYFELDKKIAAIAGALEVAGVRQDDIVVVTTMASVDTRTSCISITVSNPVRPIPPAAAQKYSGSCSGLTHPRQAGATRCAPVTWEESVPTTWWFFP